MVHLDAEALVPEEEKETNPGNVEVCGADNFMLRDGMCDEATNTEQCLWDGGDCCQDKSTINELFCKVK